MPRWGEAAAKGTRQDDKNFKRGYVAAGGAAGLGTAGAGGLMMRSGGRQAARGTREATAQSERAGRITGQLIRESQERNARAAQMRPSWHIAREESKKIDQLGELPAVRRASAAAAGYDRNAPQNIRNLQIGRLTRARRNPQYVNAEIRANQSRTMINSEMAKIKPLREANEYSEMKSKVLRTSRNKAETRAAAARTSAAAGLKRARTGKRMAIGAAALPLAALATSRFASRANDRVRRDFSPTPHHTPAPLRDNYQPSKPDTHGMNKLQREAADKKDWAAYQAAQRRRNGL